MNQVEQTEAIEELRARVAYLGAEYGRIDDQIAELRAKIVKHPDYVQQDGPTQPSRSSGNPGNQKAM